MSSAAASATPATPAPTAAAASADATPNTGSTQTGTLTAAAAISVPPETVSFKGKSYSVADLEAALNTHSTVDQAMKALAAKEAEVKASEDVWKDKGKLRAQLKKYGVSEAELAEEILLEEIQQSEMTPEQKELAELKAEKAAREKADTEAKELAKAKALEAQVAQLTEAYETQFVEAMTQSGLPRTPETMLRLTQIVIDLAEGGHEATPAEAAVLLRARLTEANRPVYEGMSVQQLRDALGPKTVDALIKAHTEELQAAANKSPDAVRTTNSKNRPASNTGKPTSIDDVINRLQSAPRRR